MAIAKNYSGNSSKTTRAKKSSWQPRSLQKTTNGRQIPRIGSGTYFQNSTSLNTPSAAWIIWVSNASKFNNCTSGMTAGGAALVGGRLSSNLKMRDSFVCSG